MTRHFLSIAVLCAASLARISQTSAVEPDYRLWDEIAAHRKIVGPLVGHVTADSASIWAYAGPDAKSLVLDIAELTSPDKNPDRPSFRQEIKERTNADEHHSVEFKVTGLSPDTTYVFAVHLADEPAAIEPGTFKTAPAGKKTKFRMSVASCFGGAYRRRDGHTEEIRGEYKNDSWHLLMNERPDFQLIIGDNVYADSGEYNHMWDAHTLERTNNRPFAQAIRTIPTYAVWDDHDFGANNSDRTNKNKEQSLRTFGEVFANPPRGKGGPGIYTNFSWGGVDFFLLDGRYHRTPNEAPDDKEKTFLGDEQFNWLIERLKASDAPFKVLVNGSTWDTSKSDGWRRFSHAKRQLWKAIVEHQIKGVMLVSGDIHRCDLPLHWPEVDGSYYMPEVTSSGLGSHGEDDKLAFAIVEFDTTLEDPTMTAKVIDGTGTQTMMRLVRASDLWLGKSEH